MRKLASFLLAGLLVGALNAATALRAQEKPEPPKPADAPKVEKPPEEDLAGLKKRYADFEPAERTFWDFLNEIGVMEKEYADLLKTMNDVTEQAKKDPQNEALRKKLEGLQAELKVRSDAHQAKGPEYMKRQKAHMETLTSIYHGIEALSKAHPEDEKLTVFRVKFMAEQGGFTNVQEEVARLFAEHPEDRDIRFIYGETCMVIPVPRHDPRDPRPPVEARAPRFEKAYEVLAPIAKNEANDPALQLIFGVAACAIGKNAEAKAALDSVASVGSIRPATRIIIGNAYDPDAAFKIWKDVADGLTEKPAQVELLKKRAELLIGVQAARLAIPDAEAALKAKPDDRDLAILLGRCYVYANSFERAAKVFGDLYKAESKDEDAKNEVRAEYGLALYSTNRMGEARDVLAEIKPEARTKLPVKLQESLMNAQPDKLVDNWTAEENARALDAKRDDNPRVVFETTKGPITIELFEDTAPNTVANFVYLVANGFYDGVRYHRVIPNFMAQGGDPTGTGMGGPGYTIKDEFDLKSNTRLHWRGTLSMAKSGAPNSGGSQFFMNVLPTPHLNGRHAVFGRVIDGQDAVDKLERDDAILKAKVLRKRAHEYVPEKIKVPGETPWAPGEPRQGDKKKPEAEKKPEVEKKPDAEKKPVDEKQPEGEKK